MAGRVGSIELLGGQDLHSGSNADPPFFDYPELALDGLILKPCENAGEDLEDVGLVLPAEAKNDEAGECGRRIGADVCEASVECDEDSTLSECRAGDGLISGTAETFLERC